MSHINVSGKALNYKTSILSVEKCKTMPTKFHSGMLIFVTHCHTLIIVSYSIESFILPEVDIMILTLQIIM